MMKTLLIIGLILVSASATAQDWVNYSNDTHYVLPRYVLDLSLVASEPVSRVPEVEFVTEDKTVHDVPLVGSVPGQIFDGTLSMATADAQSGTFTLVQGTLVDMANNYGQIITSGAYLEIESPLTLDLYIDGRGGYPEMLRMRASSSITAVTPVQIGTITTRWALVEYWYAPNAARPNELVKLNLSIGNDKGTAQRWSTTLPYMQPTEFEIRIPRGTFQQEDGWVNEKTIFLFERKLGDHAVLEDKK